MFVQARRLSSSSRSKLIEFQNRLSDNVLSGYNQLKGSLFQAMAHRMNAKDKAEMIQYWGDENGEDTMVSSRVEASQKAPVEKISRSLPTPKLDFGVAAEESTLFHPILGEKLVDLGYKTLYLTSVRSLAVAPIWKKQRILRPERSQLIANDKIKNNLGSSLSGSISFFMDKKTKEIGIIDGQHRAGALMVLAQKGLMLPVCSEEQTDNNALIPSHFVKHISGHWDERARNIVIEVFSTNTQAQVGALFREINSAEPVRLVDLLMHEEAPLADGPISSSASPSPPPSSTSTSTATPAVPPAAAAVPHTDAMSTGSVESAEGPLANTDDRKENTAQVDPSEQSWAAETLVATLDAAADSLAATYPEMFKPSSRCKPPHLNVDVLRDDLFQSEFLPRHDVRSAAELLALLDRVNAALQAQYAQADVSNQSKSAATALKKATEYGFYLGLDKAWMYGTYPPLTNSKARRSKKL